MIRGILEGFLVKWEEQGLNSILSAVGLEHLLK